MVKKEKSVCREPDVFSLESAISICISKKIMGGSSVYNNAIKRGDEIREWLSKNPTDNFIILDDDSDMCEFLNTEHFIKTTYKHGLTEGQKIGRLKC